MIEDHSIELEEVTVIPIPNVSGDILKMSRSLVNTLMQVNGEILRKVMEWCEYHKNDPPIPEDDDNSRKRTDDIVEWDQIFMRVSHDML